VRRERREKGDHGRARKVFTRGNRKGGRAVERFDLELQKILDNIQDPNTAPKAARSVVLKFTIKPDDDRGVGKYSIDAQAKLAPIMAHPGRVFLGRDKDGHGVASEEHPNQVEMSEVMNPPMDGKDGKVYHLGKEAQG